VDDSPIEVEPYFINSEPIINASETNKAINNNNIDAEQQQQQQQESKSVTQVMAELLASGYVLTESVINKGTEFDSKHGVSTTVNSYLSKMGISLTQLNQRFYSNKMTDDTTQPTTTRSVNSSNKIQNLLSSKAGLKVQGIASIVVDKVSNVHEEAKRIAVNDILFYQMIYDIY
jgi:hypothetical protein